MLHVYYSYILQSMHLLAAHSRWPEPGQIAVMQLFSGHRFFTCCTLGEK